MKPILFNTEMVRAILDGRKTVTRRVVKFRDGKNPNWTGYVKDGLTLYNGNNEPCNMPAPFKVNDILYVRETWHKYTKRVGEGETCHLAEFYGYKASVENSEDANEPWKPSIHMPKEAARIFLKVTGVRVERLQDINSKGSLQDHVTNIAREGIKLQAVMENYEKQANDFKELWDSTIKKDQLQYYSWDANPYVWVIEFEVIDKVAAMAAGMVVLKEGE